MIPPVGGDTLWVDMEAAYDDKPWFALAMRYARRLTGNRVQVLEVDGIAQRCLTSDELRDPHTQRTRFVIWIGGIPGANW